PSCNSTRRGRGMIYSAPASNDLLDQGDLIESCPVLSITSFNVTQPTEVAVKSTLQRVVVLTQTCDLANEKTTALDVAEVFDAQFLIDQHFFKSADVKGPLRAGRVWGW